MSKVTLAVKYRPTDFSDVVEQDSIKVILQQQLETDSTKNACIERKVIAGYWKDNEVRSRIASWMRTAVGVMESSHIRVMRVADNMRNVAVTEGDKVEAQIKFGWEVDTYPVNEIAKADLLSPFLS